MRLDIKLLLSLLLILTHPLSQGHVVFEEIGSIAGSTSFIHLSLPISFDAIDFSINTFTSAIAIYKSKINQTFSEAEDQMKNRPKGDPIREHLLAKRLTYEQLIDGFMKGAGRLKSRLRNLRGVLPAGPSSPHRRDRRFIGVITKVLGPVVKFASKGALRKVRGTSLLASIGQGILGTFMGFFTQMQIAKLRRDVEEIQEEQEQLVEIAAANRAAINNLTISIENLAAMEFIADKLAPAVTSADLQHDFHLIQDALEVAVHAVQQAQHRRLAVDLLTADALSDVFDDLLSVAQGNGFTLLVKYPSDLFQIETSYVYDGSQFLLILHVPMVPDPSLLRLLRLRPFPIPFSKDRALVPKPTTTLLALSRGPKRLMATIEHSDLMDCHKIGEVYICNRHGVLYKDLKATCLGALFEQDIPVARQLCDLELVPHKEAILQLQGNRFLVYSPVMFTGYIICLNGSSSEVHVRRGVNQVYVDPACHLDLKDHQLSSEYNLYLDSKIKHFAWESEDMSLFELDEEDIAEAVEIAGQKDRGVVLSDVMKVKHRRWKFPTWKTLLGFFIGFGLIGVLVVAAVTFGTHRLVRIRDRFRKLKHLLLTLVPQLATQVNTVLRHLHLPQINFARLYPELQPLQANAAMAPPPPPPLYSEDED